MTCRSPWQMSASVSRCACAVPHLRRTASQDGRPARELGLELTHGQLAGGAQATWLANVLRSLTEAYAALQADHVAADGEVLDELALSERARTCACGPSRRDHG